MYKCLFGSLEVPVIDLYKAFAAAHLLWRLNDRMNLEDGPGCIAVEEVRSEKDILVDTDVNMLLCKDKAIIC